MGVRPRLVLSLLGAVAVLSGCSGHGSITGAPRSDRSTSSLGRGQDASARELAAEAAARVQVDAKLRAGYIFQASATVHNIVVGRGREPTFILSPGDFVDVKLVPNTEPKYVIHPNHNQTRTAQSLPNVCDGCDNGAGGTPSPRPTPPPNYGPCASSGGATWFNTSTDEGGCTPRGNSKPLSCGTWTWSSRGRGSLTVPGLAGGPINDVDYVVDNGDGSCRVGNIAN